MKSTYSPQNNEEGFVLIVALMVMVVLTLIGITAVTTGIIETRIAANDRRAKETFHAADGGVQAGIELIEQNLGCPLGFSPTVATTDGADILSGFDIFDRQLAYVENMNNLPGYTAGDVLADIPSDIIRVARILTDPNNRNLLDAAPRTNLAIWGNTEYLPGSGLLMAAGNEGAGFGAAGAGAIIKYELHSQHIGVTNSKIKIAALWQHTIGQEGDCNY